jgi:DNA-binding transcriptional regulator YdaS (Cro superfamily)
MHIETYLIKNKLESSKFAELIGVSYQSVYKYITGERRPRPNILAKISEATGGQVTANDFYNLTKPTKRKK